MNGNNMDIETKILIGIIGLGFIIVFHYCVKIIYETKITNIEIKHLKKGNKK